MTTHRLPNKAEKNLAILHQKQLEIEFKLENTPYKPVQNIGTGAYGVVCSAVDARCDRKVAIKKIPNAFAALTLVKRTIREVRILKHFRHENIVAILDMFQAKGTHGYDVYMVMDLMETDLHQIIHSKQPLTEQHLQYFLYQILRGLKYIHSSGVIHRDLKPSNLLINADCLLKIGDFGMARSISQGPEGQNSFMTQYVATRWYRAPELLFSMLDYSAAIDMWSVGCIFAEMIMRRQLFPGKDHMSQLKLIIYYLGSPSSAVMQRISSDLVKRIINGIGNKDPVPWSSILPKATAEGLDLIEQMMHLEPWKRITSELALEHPYLAQFHDLDTEPVCSRQVVLETDTLESLPADQLKSALADCATKYSSFQNEKTFSSNGQKAPQNTVRKSTQWSCESPDFLEGLDDDVNNGDNDVIMLSAKLEEASISDGRNRQRLNVPAAHDDNTKQTLDAKAKLRDALQAKAAAKANPTAGAMEHTHHTTAQARALERQEKRRRRSERQSGTGHRQQGDGIQEHTLSDQDQSLLERWQKMQHESERNKFEGQIGDIISKTLPSPMTAGSSSMSYSSRNMETSSDRSNLEHQQSGERNSKQLDSAQLMDTWLQATNMDPEELQDLAKEIVTPL